MDLPHCIGVHSEDMGTLFLSVYHIINTFWFLFVVVRRVASLLLDNNADAGITTIHGFSSLHACASKGFVDIAALLIRHGSSINAVARNGFSPIHTALKQKKIEFARMLISKGANLNQVANFNGKQMTPLRLVVEMNEGISTGKADADIKFSIELIQLELIQVRRYPSSYIIRI